MDKAYVYTAKLNGKVVGKTEVLDMMPFIENTAFPYAVISRTKTSREFHDPHYLTVRQLKKGDVTRVAFFADKESAEKYVAKHDANPANKNYRTIVKTERL